MCGINGILKKDRNLDARIKNMNRSLRHRGPDSDGIYIDAGLGVAFGHRRLRVIDISDRASQPMISASGRWILVYNGEIYNYLELKKETRYPYKTNSDTEVILAYIECNGLRKFLDKCNGMFALAIYDTINKELFLCRDRLGIKPLYYYADKEMIVFSSEIKGILHSGLVGAVLDEDSIDDYFAYRYVREPYTFFKNIYQVPAGCFMKMSVDRRIQEEYYWTIPKEFNSAEKYSEDGIKAEFFDRLKEATLKRMVSDVPLGTYLSGGVDSSLLTAIVAENMSTRLHTFTVGFPELNEFIYSDLVSCQYHTQNHKITVGFEEYWENMQKVTEYKDAPLGVPNEVALAIMSKELKKSVTVVISGEGADELLGGYGKIFRSPFEYLNGKKEVDFYHYFVDKYEYVPRQIRNTLLSLPYRRRDEFDTEIERAFFEKGNEQNIFWFFHKYHIKGLLQRLDTTTMLASVEARVPFLDHELIEYTYRQVPYGLKLHWNSHADEIKASGLTAAEFSEIYDTPKYLLKETAKDFLPLNVINRKKMGFPVPLSQWSDEIENSVRKRLKGAFWVKDAAIEKLIENCARYSNGNQMLWMFISLQMFLDTYFTRKWTY